MKPSKPAGFEENYTYEEAARLLMGSPNPEPGKQAQNALLRSLLDGTAQLAFVFDADERIRW